MSLRILRGRQRTAGAGLALIFAFFVLLFGLQRNTGRLADPLVVTEASAGQSAKSQERTAGLEEDAAAPLRTARAAIAELRRSILEYYEGDELVLDPRVGRHADPAFVARFAVRVGEAAILPRSASPPAFVIAAIGSSVTAGHDAFGHVAYPAVLDRHLAPMMDAAGLRLEVDNYAVGGRGPWLSGSFCLAATLTDDIDLLVREWEYWSLDQGLRDFDVAKENANGQAAGLELFLRTALRLPSKPAISLLRLGHAETEDATARFEQTQLHTTQGALRAYGDYAIQPLAAFARPFKHLRANADRYTKQSIDAVYRSEAVATAEEPSLAACSGSERADVSLCPVTSEKPDGYHSHAKELGLPAHPLLNVTADVVLEDGDSPYAIMTRLFPERFHDLFTNWHPGALGHEVMGLQLAYLYGGYLLEGIDLLLRGEGDSEDRPLSRQDLADRTEGIRAQAAGPPLPENAACTSRWCEFRSFCATSMEPRAPMGTKLEDWLELPPAAEGGTAWAIGHVLGQPTALDPSQVPQECESYENRVRAHATGTKFTQRDADIADGCLRELQATSYHDVKRGVRGNSDAGELRVKIDGSKMMQCLVLLEEPTFGFDKPLLYANWRSEVRVTINGEPCADGACSVHAIGSGETLKMDLRRQLGSACRRQQTIIGIAVVPLEAQAIQACARTDAGECATVGDWANYDDETCDDECTGRFDADVRREVAEVEAIFASVIVL